MLNELTEYEKNTLFKDFRETIVSESKENFSTIDNFLSEYNADNMLQKRLDLTQDASYLFYYRGITKTFDFSFINSLDFSKVKSFKHCFDGYTNQSIPFIDTKSGENFSYMFNLANIININDIDLTNATTINNMFSNCFELQHITISANQNKNAVYASETFMNCGKLKVLDIPYTLKVLGCQAMFSGCDDLVSIPNFDTSDCGNFLNMFYKCASIEEIPSFDVGLASSGSNSLANMFYRASKIKFIHITNIKSSLNISYCVLMERDALLEVIGNLVENTSGITTKLTLGSTLLAKLTEDDIAIATNKNWTVA